MTVGICDRLEQLKRKKLHAIQDKTEGARIKGRSLAEVQQQAAGGQSDSDEDAGVADMSDAESETEMYANLLADLQKDCDESKVNMFGEGATVDFSSPYKFAFDVAEFNTSAFAMVKSERFRENKKNECDAMQDRVDGFFPLSHFPQNVQGLIDDLMAGPKAAMEKLLIFV